jgi:hypothetical protein
MRIAFCTLALIFSAATAFAGDAPAGAGAGVLLLRNGSVIEGTVLREGDRYEVKLEDGDLRVRADDVEFVGHSLEDCYRHRLAGIDVARVQDHLELAEWCVRNGMHSAAGRELREAMVCDPRHPMIGVLERRLKLAIEAPPTAKPAEPRQLSAPTGDELDRMVDGMPAGTVETFTTIIQPMLVNQCSTAACHGPASTNSLRLMRITASRTPSRRATQRNLYSTLENIDTENPDNSPLLTMPIRAHGTSRAAVFTSRQTQQYKQLVEWVYSVSNKRHSRKPTTETSAGDWPVASHSKPKPIAEATADNRAGSPTIAAKYLKQQDEVKRVGAIVGTDSFDGAPPKLLDHFADKEQDAADAASERLKSPRRLGRRIAPGKSTLRTPPRHGEMGDDSAPEDPFDPEAFNRQLPAAEAPKD